MVGGKVNPLRLAEEGRIRIEGLETDEALLGLLKLCWAETSRPLASEGFEVPLNVVGSGTVVILPAPLESPRVRR